MDKVYVVLESTDNGESYEDGCYTNGVLKTSSFFTSIDEAKGYIDSIIIKGHWDDLCKIADANPDDYPTKFDEWNNTIEHECCGMDASACFWMLAIVEIEEYKKDLDSNA